MVHLAAGEIRGLRAWWLRLRLARNTEWNSEFVSTRRLWQELKGLRLEESVERPQWMIRLPRRELIVRVGGFALKRSTFILAYTSLIVGITGTIILRSSFDHKRASPPAATKSVAKESWVADYDSLKSPFWVEYDRRYGIEEHLKGSDGEHSGTRFSEGDFDYHGKVHWKLTGVAEVRFRDAVTGKVVRRGFASPKNGDHLSDAERKTIPRFLWMVRGGQALSFHGFGNYPIELPAGVKLIAEIVPWDKHWTAPKDSSVRFWKEHDARLGIEENLPGSSGAADGVQTTKGYFGSEKECHWVMTGVGEVRIRNVTTGKVLRRGFACPEKGGQMSSSEHATTPTLKWFVGNREPRTFRGYGIFPVVLPNGKELTVEVIRWENRWISSLN